MTFTEAKMEFDVRYYLWATSEFEKEIEESFPTMKLFKAGSPWKTHRFMVNLPKEEQLMLAHSLLKRFHPNAVKSLGETCSTQEASLLSRRSAAFNNIVSFGDEVRARKKAGEPIKLASKRKLRNATRTQFTAAFGSECINLTHADDDTDMLLFKIRRAGWIVKTFFCFGRTHSILSYSHNVESEKAFLVDGGSVGMAMGGMISFNSYLGVSSQTEWHYLTEEEIEPSCAMVVKLCAHFFDALPKLLKGLECENVTFDGADIRGC